MTWDLTVLYNDFNDERIARDMQAVQALIDEGNGMLEAQEAPARKVERLYTLTEKLSELIERLGSFSGLTLATDATNEPAAALQDKLNALMVGARMLDSAVTRYVGAQDVEALIAQSDFCKTFAFPLRKAKEEAAHVLPAEIEPWMLRMSLSGGEAFAQLRDKLDATHTVSYRGQELPLSEARNLAYDADASVRRDAYEAELASYAKIEIPMAAALNGIKGETLTMAEAQHYDSVLDMTLAQSNMDRETLDAMLTAMKEYLPYFRKYLRKKGELLGHKDGLPFYDLFAPVSMPGYTPRVFTAEQARETLVSEMSKFTPDMGAFINEAFDNRWIDMFPRKGKGGGAFCSELHALDQSRVLTNFVGSFSDVSTLAHELGHAWHNRCMNGLPFALTGAPMPLAETASIFNETLLAHAVRTRADKREAFTILEGSLMEGTQTIVDILSRYIFETNVIETRKDHALSVNELKALMLDAQEQTYGDGLAKDARHPYMWACKCHYYFAGLNFYNFPYAFGELFGKGVFAQYLKKGSAFVKDYCALLRGCGSNNVADVTADVGINVRDVNFWRSSLDVFKADIEEFIKLADEL